MQSDRVSWLKSSQSTVFQLRQLSASQPDTLIESVIQSWNEIISQWESLIIIHTGSNKVMIQTSYHTLYMSGLSLSFSAAMAKNEDSPVISSKIFCVTLSFILLSPVTSSEL